MQARAPKLRSHILSESLGTGIWEFMARIFA